MIVPGMVSATFKKESVPYVLSITSRAGLRAVEWSENHHIAPGDTALAKAVAEATGDRGLEIASYGSYYRLGMGMDFLPSLRNAVAMDAPFIRIWAGNLPSAAVDEETRKKMVKEAGRIAEEAGSEGITVCSEWHKNTLTDTNESGLSFLEEVDSPFFRTFWQPTQALSFSQRKEGITLLGDRVENIHTYYWDESGRRPLEEGRDHWKEYFSLFGGKRRYALLEFVKDDSEEQFLRDARTLLEVIGE